MDFGGKPVVAYSRRARVESSRLSRKTALGFWSSSLVDVQNGSSKAAVLSRGLRPDSPGALGAGGFCLQAEVFEVRRPSTLAANCWFLGLRAFAVVPVIGSSRLSPNAERAAKPYECTPAVAVPDSPGGLVDGGYCL